MDESDDLDFLPPIKYIEKVNVGINTDNTEQETSKEISFKSQNLLISKKINNYTFFEIKGNSNNNKLANVREDNIRIKKVIANPSNINNKNKPKELQINSLENFIIKGKSSLPKKFKKNTTYKFKFIQTDITNDNMNKLLSFKNEKETIQKQYEEKITTLNSYIKNNISTTRNTSNKEVNNYSNIKTENKSPNKNVNNNSNPRNISS